MQGLRALWKRLRGMFGSVQADNEFDAEINSHLTMHIEDNVRAGMTPEEARRDAMLRLGGVEQTKQTYRERGTLLLVENLLQDLRFAVRQLRKNPGFTATAILMLALGMGACVAIFAFVDAALIRPLPYVHPNRLVALSAFSYPDYLDWKTMNKVFSSMAIWTSGDGMLQTPSGTVLVRDAGVSDEFFHTLGIDPVLGRDFYPGEDQPSAPNTVILSYATWQKRFSGRKNVIGQQVTLSDVPYTIIGVLPKGFQFAPRGDAEFWVALHDTGPCATNRGCHNYDGGIARLKDGVSVQTALADTTSIVQQLERQYPTTNTGQGASVLPLSEAIVGNIRPILLMLLGGSGLLLLIACINVANLLLVRTESRQREIAVRGALGASQARLIRQFVTESVLLVVMGSAIGLALAYGVMQILVRLIPIDMMYSLPFLRELGLSPHVVAFTAAIALLAAGLFSLTPIVRLPLQEMHSGLAAGGRSVSGSQWRHLGANLVVIELAVAVVLLAGAGLLGKSLYRLLHVDVGFQPDHLATLGVLLPQAGYATDAQIVAGEQQVLGRVSTLPGVKSAAITSNLPVDSDGRATWIRFEGRPYNGEHYQASVRDVSPGYFHTLQARLLRGRTFTKNDDATRPKVVLINQALARTYFPGGENPIGQRIGNLKLKPSSMKEIVGVVDNVREGTLDSKIAPTIYYPFRQDIGTNFYVIVRTPLNAESILAQMNAAIHQVDPGIVTADPITMNDSISDSRSVYLHRSSAWLIGGFAMLALVLAVVGLYGVVAYSVSQRTREIGVRIALGAQRSSIYQLVLKEAGRLIVFGIAVGLLGAIGAGMLMRTLLFGTQAWDISTLAVVAVVLAAAALTASYIPARSAASVNPVEALRAE